MKCNRMKRIQIASLLLALSSLLLGCGTPPRKGVVPIEDRSVSREPAKPVIVTQAAVKTEEPGVQYVVKKGDTLYRIALDKGQSYSDIVSWNNLANPNDIKVGQVLRVAAPDTTGQTVVTQPGVEVRSLVSVNGNNKNAPRADKRPYSDVTLAEMQKNEVGEVAAGKLIAKSVEKTAEKVTEPAINDEIVWIWPAEGKVVANFDDNKSKGIDISGKMGQDIFAAAAGTVMYAGSGIRGYGNLVIIKHSNNLLSAYAYNKTIVVKEKQLISKGQKIAEMGNSDSDSVKLHFEIRQQGKPVDPTKYLPGR